MDQPVADAIVRDATAADAMAIGEVQATAWRSSYGDVLPAQAVASLQPAELAQAWRDAIVRPPSGSHRVLVAVAAGAVVGFAAVAPSDDAKPELGEIAALVVSPGAERHGHGSRLLNAAVERLRNEGFAQVVTWVLEGDEVRMRFLAGAGFADDGGRRGFDTGIDTAQLREVRMVATLRDEA